MSGPSLHGSMLGKEEWGKNILKPSLRGMVEDEKFAGKGGNQRQVRALLDKVKERFGALVNTQIQMNKER